MTVVPAKAGTHAELPKLVHEKYHDGFPDNKFG
jgi:hypothetical protein